MLTWVLIMVPIVAGGHMVGAGVAVGVGVGEGTGVGSSTQPEAATASKAKIQMASSLKSIFHPPCGWRVIVQAAILARHLTGLYFVLPQKKPNLSFRSK